MDREKLLFYPWSMSATGDWSPETGIYLLRDKTPEDLAEILWEPGIYVQNSAIVELIRHGNPRKAAEVARALVKAHPIVEKSIKEGFGEEFANYLFKTQLDTLPSKPEEYDNGVNVQYEYIQ